MSCSSLRPGIDAKSAPFCWQRRRALSVLPNGFGSMKTFIHPLPVSVQLSGQPGKTSTELVKHSLNYIVYTSMVKLKASKTCAREHADRCSLLNCGLFQRVKSLASTVLAWQAGTHPNEQWGRQISPDQFAKEVTGSRE